MRDLIFHGVGVFCLMATFRWVFGCITTCGIMKYFGLTIWSFLGFRPLDVGVDTLVGSGWSWGLCVSSDMDLRLLRFVARIPTFLLFFVSRHCNFLVLLSITSVPKLFKR